MATIHVPGTHPTLAEAVEAAQEGDHIQLTGDVQAKELRIRKPLEISGGSIQGDGGFALGLFADVQVHDTEIVHLGGHGVVVMEGSPTLSKIKMRVGATAIACGQKATPRIQDVHIQGCTIGLSVQDQAQPMMQDCMITSSGSAMFFRNQAGGLISSTALSSGKMAAVEVTDQASPTLAGVAVAASAAGGFFFNQQATPTISGCLIQRTGLAGMEVTDQANPQIDGLMIKEGMAGGIFLHGESTGTYLEVEVHNCALSAIEISEKAKPEFERTLLKGGGGGGLFVQDQAVLESIDLVIDGVTFQALEAAGESQVVLENAKMTTSGSFGVYARDQSKTRLVGCEISGGREWGVRIQDAAVLAMEGGRIDDNHMGAVMGSGGGQVLVDSKTEIKGTQSLLERSGVTRA
jgi:hypothetical protein